MRDVIGKLLKDNNMPDTPNARAIYRKMLEPDDDKTQTYKKPWVGLTEADWEWVADKKETSLDTFAHGAAWAADILKGRNK